MLSARILLILAVAALLQGAPRALAAPPPPWEDPLWEPLATWQATPAATVGLGFVLLDSDDVSRLWTGYPEHLKSRDPQVRLSIARTLWADELRACASLPSLLRTVFELGPGRSHHYWSRTYYRKVLASSPDAAIRQEAIARIGMGALWDGRKSGDMKQVRAGESGLKRAIALAPTTRLAVESAVVLAQDKADQGRTDLAKAELRRFIDRAGGSLAAAVATYRLGQLCRSLEDMVCAADAFGLVLLQIPESADEGAGAVRTAARIAREECARAQRLAPDAPGWLEKAIAAKAGGRADAAADGFVRVILAIPRDAAEPEASLRGRALAGLLRVTATAPDLASRIRALLGAKLDDVERGDWLWGAALANVRQSEEKKAAELLVAILAGTKRVDDVPPIIERYAALWWQVDRAGRWKSAARATARRLESADGDRQILSAAAVLLDVDSPEALWSTRLVDCGLSTDDARFATAVRQRTVTGDCSTALESHLAILESYPLGRYSAGAAAEIGLCLGKNDAPSYRSRWQPLGDSPVLPRGDETLGPAERRVVALAGAILSNSAAPRTSVQREAAVAVLELAAQVRVSQGRLKQSNEALVRALELTTSRLTAARLHAANASVFVRVRYLDEIVGSCEQLGPLRAFSADWARWLGAECHRAAAARRSKRCADSYGNRGSEFADNLQIYREFRTTSPELGALALFNVGVMFENSKHLPRAIAVYRHIAQEFPQEETAPKALLTVAVIHESQGQLREAAETHDELARFPKSPEAAESLSAATHLYEALGDRRSAIDSCRALAALPAAPSWAAARLASLLAAEPASKALAITQLLALAKGAADEPERAAERAGALLQASLLLAASADPGAGSTLRRALEAYVDLPAADQTTLRNEAIDAAHALGRSGCGQSAGAPRCARQCTGLPLQEGSDSIRLGAARCLVDSLPRGAERTDALHRALALEQELGVYDDVTGAHAAEVGATARAEGKGTPADGAGPTGPMPMLPSDRFIREADAIRKGRDGAR